MTVDPAAERPVGWAEFAAGPATVASVTALTGVDPTTLDGADIVDAIVCTEKATSLLLGIQAQLMARLATPFVAGDPMRLAARLARRSGLADGDDDDGNVQAMVEEAAQSLAASEVAAALRIAPVTAGIRIREARHLTQEFTPARHSLEQGLIDRGKLRAIVDRVQVLPTEHIGPVLDQLLPETVDRSTSEIRGIADQAVIAADPEGAADRHRQAAARRDVTVTPDTDAMATLKAFLPADGAVKIFQVSDLLATGTAGIPTDRRGIGARRADALIDIADQLLTNGHVDITGYLGPLPDHGWPTPRVRPRPTGTPTDRAEVGTPRCPAAEAGAATASGELPTGAADLHPSPADLDRTGTHMDDPEIDVAPVVAELAIDATVPSEPEPPHGPTPDNGTRPGDSVCWPDDTAGPAPAPTTDQPSTATPPTDRRPEKVLTRQGRRPHLTVTMSLDTLAGLNDLPAVLAGFGSIPADMARTIAASAGTITAAVTDPATGAVVDCGELTYRPRQALRDKVGVLTDTCQFPSCRQPVWRCDIDHREPFNRRDRRRGGRTTVVNTEGLCRRHHLLKTHAGWQLQVDTSRLVINWTSPTGHTYSRRRRQTAPPDAWIRTAGTTIAEQLDLIATMRAYDIPPTAAEITALVLNQTDSAHSDVARTDPIESANADPDPTTGPVGPGADPETPCGPGTSAVEDGLTEALLHHALSHPTEIDCDDPELTVSRDDRIPDKDDTDETDETDETDDEPPPF